MELLEYLKNTKRAALAFSGGVDSAYLLYAAVQSGMDIKPYYVKSEFQPEFELNDAKRLAKDVGAELSVIEANALAQPEIAVNAPDRCYYCKQHIFGKIIQAASKDGYNTIFDGTNASDDIDDRPGMRAISELNIKSPLRECGLTKADIRALSKEAGLFTWNKPAYACLATRIKTGETITREKLTATELCESYLGSLGFSDLRVRQANGIATIELPMSQIPLYEEKRGIIKEFLLKYYKGINKKVTPRQSQ